ncbi:MAG: hypothetical protein ACFFDY_15330, partial [Candidatus Thorarchaeota archaeon]
MDVEKFNKVLKTKVALAKGCERRNEIESAIKIWLEISEMTLNFSKSRNINTTYKNMLINRTKSIVAHIKNLKAGQLEKVLFDEEIILEEDTQEETTSESIDNDVLVSHKIEKEEIEPRKEKTNNDVSIIENSEFKSIPEGFKEIQTSKDFKIITPHDEDYVKKHLDSESDSNHEQSSKPPQERFDFEPPKDHKGIICFACGYDKNTKNDKVCKSCGTELN